MNDGGFIVPEKYNQAIDELRRVGVVYCKIVIDAKALLEGGLSFEEVWLKRIGEPFNPSEVK